MEKKKFQSVSIAALIVSILPLAALAPSLLHLSLSDGVRTAWAGANIVFVLLGLILSVVCVRSRESRSIINIVSTAISVFCLLLMVGIVALDCIQKHGYLLICQCFLLFCRFSAFTGYSRTGIVFKNLISLCRIKNALE